MSEEITRAVTWAVHVGDYTAPVIVVAPVDAEMSDIARTGKLAMLHKQLSGSDGSEQSRDWYEREFVGKEVTGIKRVEDVYLDPRIAVP